MSNTPDQDVTPHCKTDMKILTVNRNYFVTGGPEKYMFSLMENMPQHEFIPFSVSLVKNLSTPYERYFADPPAGRDEVYYNQHRLGVINKLIYAGKSVYSFEARRKLEALIRDTRPDVALFLNAVYFSDSIIDACHKYDVPIIWRMSDFNKVCANYLLFRDGLVCEECLDHGLMRAIVNKCCGYQRSTAGALIKTLGMWLTRTRRGHDHVDYFVTPSLFTREKMIKGGFNPQKVVHIPTMVTMPKGQPKPLPIAPEILFIGRISHEKGVATLLDAFGMMENKEVHLSIVGDYESQYAQQLQATITDDLKNRITFHGFLNQEQIGELIELSNCIVVPSVWYENQPNTVLEGMSHGRPVVVSDLGSMKEMVINGETGYRFKAGNPADLAAKLDDLLKSPEKAREMGLRARDYVLREHSLQRHLSSLEELFSRVIERRNSGNSKTFQPRNSSGCNCGS